MRIGAALLALVLASQPAAPEPTLDTVLARAAAYVADYQKRLAGIVAEEHYRQRSPTRRGPGAFANSASCAPTCCW
jgi:hypothetical protein